MVEFSGDIRNAEGSIPSTRTRILNNMEGPQGVSVLLENSPLYFYSYNPTKLLTCYQINNSYTIDLLF